MDDFLHLGEQDGLRACERFEGKEERINDDRLQEEHHQQDWDGSEPEVEPPAARAAPDDEIEYPDQHRANNQHNGLVQDPVACPCCPGLHREPVNALQRLIPNVRDDSKDRNRQQNQGREDDQLHEAVRRDALGQVANCRRDPPSQNDQQNQKSVKSADEDMAIVSVRIRFSPGVLLRRRRVFQNGVLRKFGPACLGRSGAALAGGSAELAGLVCAPVIAGSALAKRQSRTMKRMVLQWCFPPDRDYCRTSVRRGDRKLGKWQLLCGEL